MVCLDQVAVKKEQCYSLGPNVTHEGIGHFKGRNQYRSGQGVELRDGERLAFSEPKVGWGGVMDLHVSWQWWASSAALGGSRACG